MESLRIMNASINFFITFHIYQRITNYDRMYSIIVDGREKKKRKLMCLRAQNIGWRHGGEKEDEERKKVTNIPIYEFSTVFNFRCGFWFASVKLQSYNRQGALKKNWRKRRESTFLCRVEFVRCVFAVHSNRLTQCALHLHNLISDFEYLNFNAEQRSWRILIKSFTQSCLSANAKSVFRTAPDMDGRKK